VRRREGCAKRFETKKKSRRAPKQRRAYVTATTCPQASWVGSTHSHTLHSPASSAHRKRDVAKLIFSSRVSTAAGEQRCAELVRGPRVHADTEVVHTEDAPLCSNVTFFSGSTALAREYESPTGQKNLPGQLISTLCVTPHTQIILRAEFILCYGF
jgi:hypothetical protein